MSCFHGFKASNLSKVVPVSSRNDAARNRNNADLNSQAKIITSVHVVSESNTEKSSPVKRNCVLDCQDIVHSWRELDLSSLTADDSEPRKACPDFCGCDFLSREAFREFLPSPAENSHVRSASPDSPLPLSSTHDSLEKIAYRDSPNRLSSVLEESESFAEREGINFTAAIADPFYYTSHTPSPITRDSVGEKMFFKQKKTSPVYEGSAKKATKIKSMSSLVLDPLKKILDSYVRCMMSIEGAGDLAGMVQGGHIASTGAYFAESPLSKTDAMNYG